MTEHVLRGLDAANPLAYLAALGTLRIAALMHGAETVAMRWEAIEGALRPRLRIDPSATGTTHAEGPESALCEGLLNALRQPAELEALSVADDLTLPLGQWRQLCERAAAQSTSPASGLAAFLPAFGSDAAEARENGKPSGKMADTAFRTMSGAGHQHFLGFMRTLAEDTSAEHLHRSLFDTWQYDDPVESHTMRWDPVDDVRYALRARDSSGDPERRRGGSMWGANRLAIAALPLFPTMPTQGGGLETTGFTVVKGEGAAWTWPVWQPWCRLDALRSLLALRELQAPRPRRDQLSSLGVIEVFRCLRIRQGKYRNFTPAEPV
ncbi:MAG: hypothetical protein KGL18_01945 [Burkholderiales bacterium]|nr:hypothetical protein [Burkholderiales bacterium]MDE1926904.1 hypothetical protein [Burkholderiales bacterium]MDE2157523.1 hypothetical protein [Burkholderiales bacterium]MDE2501729.1 hypothetical protein [Burkholderiales bacterium]